SLSGHRILARVEIELAKHGGNENGKLPVTYEHFIEYGIHKDSVAPAIPECEALGFLEVTERGQAGNRRFRAPSLDPLCNLTLPPRAPARRTTVNALKRPRRPRPPAAPRARCRPATQKTTPGKRQISAPENGGETPNFRPRKTGVLPRPRKTGVPLDSRVNTLRRASAQRRPPGRAKRARARTRGK